MNGESHLPIEPSALEEHKSRANSLLTLVKWKPQKTPVLSQEKKSIAESWSSTPTGSVEQSTSILKTLKEQISKDPLVLSEDTNHIVHTLRDGISIGLAVGKLYGQACGLDILSQQNSRPGGLASAQQGEFSEKQSTLAAVTLFVTAMYVVWKLSSYKDDEVSGVTMDFPGLPEIYLTNVIRGLDCSIFWLGFYLEKSGMVKTDKQALKLTRLYFEKLIEEIQGRSTALRHTDFFTRVSYQLKGEEFIIKGFEEVQSVITVGTEFNRTSFDQIVGNQEAKHAARRLAQRLVCYDLKACRNPFQELGGVSNVSMGFGKPGTGKSLQIAATATLIDDLCKKIGIPFLFWPLPDNVVSTFQGGSAERMLPWIKRLQDKDKIVYASIDDAENTVEERTRQGVSAGVREVIGVFLRYTEGAYAIQRGNSVIQMFTNLPEQVDKAVLSRIQSRFPIDGAQSLHDFADQDYLWWKRIADIDKAFVDMSQLAGYQFLADQAEVKSLLVIEEEPTLDDEKMVAILKRVEKQFKRTEHAFYATLFKQVHEAYPFFTSRDVRNIQKAIDARLLDFDLPEEWFEDMTLFFGKDYEVRLELIKGLMRENMKGLSFAEIRYRETVKYLKVVATIENTERERAIVSLLRDMDVRMTAKERFDKSVGAN